MSWHEERTPSSSITPAVEYQTEYVTITKFVEKNLSKEEADRLAKLKQQLIEDTSKKSEELKTVNQTIVQEQEKLKEEQKKVTNIEEKVRELDTSKQDKLVGADILSQSYDLLKKEYCQLVENKQALQEENQQLSTKNELLSQEILQKEELSSKLSGLITGQMLELQRLQNLVVKNLDDGFTLIEAEVKRAEGTFELTESQELGLPPSFASMHMLPPVGSVELSRIPSSPGQGELKKTVKPEKRGWFKNLLSPSSSSSQSASESSNVSFSRPAINSNSSHVNLSFVSQQGEQTRKQTEQQKQNQTPATNKNSEDPEKIVLMQ